MLLFSDGQEPPNLHPFAVQRFYGVERAKRLAKLQKRVWSTENPSQVSRWWFQIFFIFTPIWGTFPI